MRRTATLVALVVAMTSAEAVRGQTRATPPPADTPSRSQASGDGAVTVGADVAEGYDDSAAGGSAIGVPATRLGLFGGPYSAAAADVTVKHAGSRLHFDA